MKNIFPVKILMISISFIVLLSCASEEKKLMSQGADIANKAFGHVEEMKDAYINGDTKKLRKLCSEEMFSGLSGAMEEENRPDMEFRMKWVTIDEDGTVNLYISWNDKGEDRKGARMAQFVFQKNPFVVISIMRDNPFSR